MATHHIEYPTRAAASAPAAVVSAADEPPPPTDLEDAFAAYQRVEAEALALTDAEITPMNLDVISGAAIILGVLSRVVAYRARLATLAEFDVRHVDRLADYAKAAWYAAATNLPRSEPKDFRRMLEECAALRRHLLTWAVPLVHAGPFEQAHLDAIKKGSGHKDLASDVVALVALYRAKWDEVRGMCGVSRAELDRGAVLGPALFAAVARRETERQRSSGEASQRVRRFWTLADRAYQQCRRAIAYLEWELDVSSILPSLRRNPGVPRKPSTPMGPTPGDATSPPVVVPSVAPIAPAPFEARSSPQLGGNAGPFRHGEDAEAPRPVARLSPGSGVASSGAPREHGFDGSGWRGGG